MENTPAAAPASLAALPFHAEMAAYLRANEKALWSWFAETKQQQAYADAVRLELLKSTYRLERDGHASLYAACDQAATKLSLSVPVTFYQSHGNTGAFNATVCALPGEAHIVLSGPVLEALTETELVALIGHELGHFKLQLSDDGALGITARILDAIADDMRAEPSHIQSAVRFRLYAEIYADRCSWLACNDLHAPVACLVKAHTGLKDVHAPAYIAQADEIFSKSDVVTEGLTHPETYIRARALAKWTRGDPDAETEVRRMIEGPLHLDALDLLGQSRLTRLTRRLADTLLAPAWLRTEPVLGHARILFHDYTPPAAGAPDEALVAELRAAHASVQDYCCCLLLDFAAVDPTLDELPLVHALELAAKLDLRDRFEELANRELRITKKALAKYRQSGPEMLEKAGRP